MCAECVGMWVLEIRKQNPESTPNLSSDLTMKAFTHANLLDTFNSASLIRQPPIQLFCLEKLRFTVKYHKEQCEWNKLRGISSRVHEMNDLIMSHKESMKQGVEKSVLSTKRNVIFFSLKQTPKVSRWNGSL